MNANLKAFLKYPKDYIKSVVFDIQMLRKGLVRTAPRVAVNGKIIMKGSVYMNKEEHRKMLGTLPAGVLKSRVKGTLTAKVTRADGSEEIYVIDDQGQRRIK